MNLNVKDKNIILEETDYTKYLKVENELDSIIAEKYNEEKSTFKLNINSTNEEKTVIEVLEMKDIKFAVLADKIIVNISNEALSSDQVIVRYLESEKIKGLELCEDILSIILLIFTMVMIKEAHEISNWLYNILSKTILITIFAMSLIDIKRIVGNVFIDKRIANIINIK